MWNPELIKARCPQNSCHFEQKFTKDKLPLVANILRPLLLLYDRSNCSKMNNTWRFADEKLITLCTFMHKKNAQKEAYEADEQRFVSQTWEKNLRKILSEQLVRSDRKLKLVSHFLWKSLDAYFIEVCKTARVFKIVGCKNNANNCCSYIQNCH